MNSAYRVALISSLTLNFVTAANVGLLGTNNVVLRDELKEVEVWRRFPFHILRTFKKHDQGDFGPNERFKRYLRPIRVTVIDFKGVDHSDEVIYK